MGRSDAQRSRARILEAAERVLAQDPAAPAEEIITAAGVHRATFYRHFPSRDDLTSAVYRQFAAELRRVQHEAQGREDPVEALEHIAGGSLNLMQRSRLFRYAEPRGFDGEEVRETTRSVQAFLTQAFEEGRLRSDMVPDELLQIYAALLTGLSTQPFDELGIEGKTDLMMRAIGAQAPVGA